MRDHFSDIFSGGANLRSDIWYDHALLGSIPDPDYKLLPIIALGSEDRRLGGHGSDRRSSNSQVDFLVQ